MELWIRSQDREYLGKVEEIILIYDCLCSDEVQLFHIDSDKARLGSYKTEERALEVLDEIQSKLKGTFLMKMKKDGYQDVIPAVKQHFEELNSVCLVTGDENFDLEPINKDIYVYEMPEN